MNDSRRDFLKKTGYAALGIGVGCAGGFPLLAAARKALPLEHGHAAPASKQWGMVVDIKKCLNEELVNACIDACHSEHNVPKIPDPEEEIKWIWTENYENVFPDQAHAHTAEHLKKTRVLVLCNHCTRPSCVRVCPTQATWKRKSDGIVMMDMHRCIGCRYCMAACPFGARSFNWGDPRKYLDADSLTDFPTRTTGVVEKCNFCAERLRHGQLPACVEAAGKITGGALTFGDLSDPGSKISRILHGKHTIVRRLELGTGPNVFYIV